MALIAAQQLDIDESFPFAYNGSGAPWTACANAGDTFQNDDKTELIFYNSGTSKTVTIAKQIDSFRVGDGRFGNIVTANKAITVDQNKVVTVRVPTGIYNDADGIAHMTYSSETGLSAIVARRE